MALAGSLLERPNLNASDVVFMYAPEAELYEVYSGTIVGWAGRAMSKSPKDVLRFRQRVVEAQRHNLRYCGSVDFVVDFAGFIEFSRESFAEAICRDLDNNPITVPWLWDHKHKGHPAYWFCTNNPDYRAYLRDQVERACAAPIDGLHIDDWRGTSACSAWNGGCFCHHCMEGFRNWLKRNFSREQLQAMEVNNIDEFDLRSFLRAKGVTADDWKRRRRQLPFGELFQQFQTEQALSVIREAFEYAEKLCGKPLLRSVNSSASSPEDLVVAPLIDFFCGEMNHHASTAQVSFEPAFVFKVVEGLGKRQVATASGYDWAWIAANEKPGLVRSWIAQAYAFGSAFMVPHRQWCYTKEKGTHWWRGKPEDFAFVYRFVREKASLLDGYRSLANLALVYTNHDFGEIRSAAIELLKANVPFAIVIAEPSLGTSVSASEIEAYDFLLTGKQGLPTEIERQLRATKPMRLQWRGLESLPEQLHKQVIVKGGEKIRVSLRYKPNTPNAPIVCHLLNQDYDIHLDDARPANVSISINPSLIKRARSIVPKTAIIHAPKQELQQASVRVENNMLTFTVPHLGLWAIVELR